MVGKFDVFVTVDGNLQYQQNLSEQYISVVVLVVTSNRLQSLLPLMPMVREQLLNLQPGKIIRVETKR